MNTQIKGLFSPILLTLSGRRSELQMTAISILILVGFGSPAIAQQAKGYIQNDEGKKCWYTQIKTADDTYFHSDGITSNTASLTFDDPLCMSDSGTGLGLDINKMMINNVITRTYSHADADFGTRVSEMFSSSLLQIRGSCIQSGKYPAIGVTVDYIISNNSITGVVHGPAANGCRK
jgi:hypothetical protein